ncbi:hypothetical protein KP79_PYT21063 [Mizuhopecten yessoensis]|uniref:IgGFc-binding protein N-terminal domain-containing protein n=1 Tax=Mizuhopecten yessoensis TaxID=6573 RepID=A0A210QA18_MIZYE|nr:hypothetical protein KP79_PYT21063 [Mizuhopecten yessoensis]
MPGRQVDCFDRDKAQTTDAALHCYQVNSSVFSTLIYGVDINIFGRDFVLSFNRNAHKNDTTRLRVMNNLKDKVTMTIYTSFGSEVSKSDDTSEIIEHHLLTACQQTFSSGDCVVRIKSIRNVRMTVLNIMDGEIYYFVLPLDKIGNEYIMATSLLPGNYTCDLIAVYPSTELSFSVARSGPVTFANKKRFCNRDNCKVPVLRENAILQLRSTQDMTGMKVRGNKPFAVYCGGEVSTARTFMNQLPPIGMYGTSYQTWPTIFPGFVSLTSRCNDTHVHVYGSKNLTTDLDLGIHTELTVLAQDVLVVSSDKPIMVIQSWSMHHALHRLTLVPLVTANHTCDDHAISTQQPLCMCPCPTKVTTPTPVDLNTKLQKLRELSVNKSTLSSTRRKKQSAYDGRTSAKGIGIIGVTLLCGVVVFIVVLDMPNLVAQFRVVRQNLFGGTPGQFGPKLEWKRNKLMLGHKSESTATIAHADTDKEDF